MSRFVCTSLGVVVASLLMQPVCIAAQASGDLKLTQGEQDWLRSHPTLRVASELDWAPINYSEDGEAKGYGIGVISLIAEKTGLRLEFVGGYTFAELLEQFRAGEIDVMPAIYADEDLRAYTEFTDGYYTLTNGIVVERDRADITDIASLSGKRVAGVVDHPTLRALRRDVPDLEVVPVSSNVEGIEVVSRGAADAYVVSVGVARYLLQRNFVADMKVIGAVDLGSISSPELRMGVATGDTVLLSILNKALASINILEERQIYNRWIPRDTAQERIRLSSEQEQWLQEHPGIRIGVDPAFAPYSYLSRDGKIIGVAPDFIELISRKLGADFEIVSDLAWPEIVEGSRKRTLDVIATAVITPERREFLGFTPTYIPTPLVIMTRQREDRILNGPDLRGRTVAMVKGYSTSKRIVDEQPGVIPLEVSSPLEALKAVATREADAYVGVLGVVLYENRANGISGLKVAGRYDLETHGQRFAVRSDWPELTLMLNQALDSISESERKGIYDTWISVPVVETEIDYTVLWQTVAIFSVIVVLLYFYIRRLMREIKLRKAAQGELLLVNESLREAKKTADQASAAKSTFLSNMSHEIRTPLNGIIGMTTLLLNQKLDGEAREFTATIRNSGDALLTLIEDILDFSRIESDKLELMTSRVNPRECLDQAMDLVRMQAAEKGLELTLSVDRSVPGSALLDAGRIRQVLVNLLHNAIKFTEQGSVSLDACGTEVESGGLSLDISIADTGVGIPSEDLESLFGAFEQGASVDPSVQGGTGLGLTISRRLIDLMGGHVSMTSTEGEGTTLILSIPLQAGEWLAFDETTDVPDRVERQVSLESLGDHPSLRILVTEDNDVNRRVLCLLLKEIGYEPDEAESGEVAVMSARSGEYDLIFMDLRMPGIDGMEAARQIRSEGNGGNPPRIVALTGDATVEARQRCFEAGMDDYMTKPVSLADLEAALQRTYT